MSERTENLKKAIALLQEQLDAEEEKDLVSVSALNVGDKISLGGKVFTVLPVLPSYVDYAVPVLADEELERSAYGESGCTYSNSKVRQICLAFYNSLSNDEKLAIQPHRIWQQAGLNKGQHIDKEPTFLLSAEDVHWLFARGIAIPGSDKIFWLRDKEGAYSNLAWCVNPSDSDVDNYNVTYSNGVRPACLLKRTGKVKAVDVCKKEEE